LPDPRRGFAIIGESAEKARLFAVGANLPNGARLDQVLPDRVVLALNGAEQVLLLPHLRGGAVPEIAVEQSAAAEVAAADVGDVGQGEAVATDPREFSQARHWFNGFAAQPIAQDDGIQGYVLHPNMRYKREYGVADGDVVTSINGVALADMDAAATELQKFSGQVVSMTVVHDGVPQDMELQVN
jgi:general secretion pathway protein C